MFLLNIVLSQTFIDEDLKGKAKLVACIYLTRDRLNKDEETFLKILNNEKIEYLKDKTDLEERNSLMQILLIHCTNRISVPDAFLINQNYKIKNLDSMKKEYVDLLDMDNVEDVFIKKDKNVFQKELARLEERLKDLYKETPDKIKKEEI